ncbi:MAG TPA: PAS domain-containing protein [Chthoniobacterales bacterium]|nr:PAS domain-containing protein [Chthoniobacterales bacterium]
MFAGACYYGATQVAWALCFPNSKVSLFFPPHAVLVSILLLVPSRHWWAYTLAAAGAHFLATQQAHWPPLYALHCEAFDAFQNVATAALIRLFIKSPLNAVTLRDAVVFVLVAGVIVPFGSAFWGAAFTISNHFGTYYWIEWRNLGISNAVTAVVLVPAILLGVHHLIGPWRKIAAARLFEGAVLGVGLLTVGAFAFGTLPAGPETSPIFLYAPIPFLVWAALRFGLTGTSASVLIITFQAIWGTMHGRGPFLMQSPAENALALQMFLLVTAIPLLFLAILIEEERRSQSALRESEVRMSLAASAGNLGLWTWNIPRDDIWLNNTGRALFGLNDAKAVNFSHFLEVVHADDRERMRERVQAALSSKEDYESEYRITQPSGETRWVAGYGRVEFDERGKAIVMRGAMRDITLRKRAERSLRESEARLSAAIEVAALGLYELRLQPELAYFDERARSILGIPPEDDARALDYWAQHVHPDDRDRVVELQRQLLEGELERIAVEYRFLHPTRGLVWLHELAHVMEYDSNRQATLQIGVFQDITEQKQAELDHQLQAMELARVGRLALMGEMAASLAHEINNPLGAMVTNASAGQRLLSHGQLRADELHELLADIAADGQRAREVIQGIRNMARKGETARSLVDMKDVIQDLIRIVRADAAVRKVSLVAEVDPHPGVVMADRVQLLQVLLNLTMNAFEALTVMRAEARRVVIRAERVLDGKICVKVRDAGPGFPSGLAEQLFEPFFSTKAEGTGMGLAIARSIIEAHGGMLSAENCAEGGALFTICLPEAAQSASRAA